MTGPGQKDTHVKWDRQDERKHEQSASIPQSFKALQIKRFDLRVEPFQGFNSPPGRF
ncbi:MAG: hypothetical protein ACE5FA_07030 [Dehalococcoidia bacterium]